MKIEDYSVIEWDKDIRQVQSFNSEVDTVIHLAGITQFDTQSNIVNGYEINVEGTLAVLDYCKEKGATCILASTSAVYGDNKSVRIVKETDPITPISHYGISKSLAEMACRQFVEDYNISCQILRIFNVYGPGQKRPFLIPDIIDSINNKEELIIRTPNAVRDFIHVCDVANVFIQCLQTNCQELQVFNVGSGEGTQISLIADLINSYTNHPVNIIHGHSETTIESGTIADTQNVRRILNWVNTIDIQTGLESIIKNYQSDNS